MRGLALAVALYAAGLACLLVAPLLVIEMVQPPKAGIVPIVYLPRGSRGDNQPTGTVRRGESNGTERAGRSRNGLSAPLRRQARPHVPIAPPEPEVPQASAGTSGADDGGDRPGEGDPDGKGTLTEGPLTGCPECPGTGPGDPGGGEGIYQQGTPGLTPPQLVPSTRALPKYPDLPRRAGIQGTVILLVVVEKDGTVGEIEVVRSPEQRWGFDLAAIDAVKQWRYQPALLGAVPVAAYITVMVEFTLSR